MGNSALISRGEGFQRGRAALKVGPEVWPFCWDRPHTGNPRRRSTPMKYPLRWKLFTLPDAHPRPTPAASHVKDARFPATWPRRGGRDANNGAYTYGGTLSFLVPLPKMLTEAASSITSDSAVLNGTVNPNGSPGYVYLYYGTSATTLNSYKGRLRLPTRGSRSAVRRGISSRIQRTTSRSFSRIPTTAFTLTAVL